MPVAQLIYVSGDGGLRGDRLLAALIHAFSQTGIEVRPFDLLCGLHGRLDEEELRCSVRSFCADSKADQALILCGYSRGARLCVELSQELQALGVIALGYPFHGTRQSFDSERVQQLTDSRVPILIIQGTRDPHGNRDQVRGYKLPSHVSLQWLQGAKHAVTQRLLASEEFEASLVAAVSFAQGLLRRHHTP